MNFSYPEELPISAHRKKIHDALESHQVLIISGDTGSGKTTQIPKICLELTGREGGRIGCTQPRRIAASSVADRVAEELGQQGSLVGYKIRFHDYTTPATRIKFMTDGVLLAETKSDPLLKSYAVIILDEAHERSLNIDFLLGYLKKILPKRPDLKLVITSATIDTEAFSTHFNNAPVIAVSGRTYPVDIHYRPQDGDGEGGSYVEHCAETIAEIRKHHPPGDILAFLPTEKDIRTCCDLLTSLVKDTVILPLFGRLQSGDQRRIFQRHHQPKIVVATNVAETSITVPGIRYVVDSGLARLSYYNARAKTTSLPVQKISRAACDQRKGRCGRIGPGICFRLYEEEDYLGREEFTLPEIKRANLADVILQMIRLQLGRPDDFPFIDPPLRSAIRDGYALLFELGAIDGANRLTQTGSIMAGLPIDPCISRILIEAGRERCVREIKIIASALAIQDPRVRPAEKEKVADEAHKQFAHPHSDFMAYLNLWEHFHQTHGENWSWTKLKNYCKSHYLSFQRMREWMDLHDQLGRVIQGSSAFEENQDTPSYQQIHRSLASGFLRNIAVRKQGKLYQNGLNQELMIFPGSHQFLTGGRWIMAATFLETNRLYGLTVATIEPDWLETLAQHLVKYSWSEARWNKKSGQVVAEERVSLFGLVIVAGRTVNYPKRSSANIDEARKIFIQNALIEGNLGGRYPFLEHNNQLIDMWRKEEDKLRSTSILHDDSVFFAFYQERLPSFVCDRPTLNRHLKKNGDRTLHMQEDDILLQRPDEHALADFPNTIHAGSLELQVEYHFAPGASDDGLTIRIPALSAEVLNPTVFEWLVPGLLQEKITVLFKGLPKRLRKHLVPVNVAVDRVMDDITFAKGSLLHTLESAVHKLYRIQIKRSDWPADLPAHLTPRYLLFAGDGSEICSGRSLPELIEKVRQTNTQDGPALRPVSRQQNSLVEKWRSVSTRNYAFDDLPDRVQLAGPKGEFAGFLFPMLVVKPGQGEVGVEFSEDPELARQENKIGVEQLYRFQFADGYKSLKKYTSSLFSGPSVKLFLSTGITGKSAQEQFLGFILRSLFPSIDGTIPSRKVFETETADVRQKGLYKEGQEIADAAIQILRRRGEVHKRLQHFCALDHRGILFTREKREGFTALLEDIVSSDYFASHTRKDIDDTLRQLKCLELRMERFHTNPLKDSEKMKQLEPHLNSLKRLSQKNGELSQEALRELRQYKFLIDEFRISLFSPEIGTRTPVSAKKLQKQLQAVEAVW